MCIPSKKPCWAATWMVSALGAGLVGRRARLCLPQGARVGQLVSLPDVCLWVLGWASAEGS